VSSAAASCALIVAGRDGVQLGAQAVDPSMRLVSSESSERPSVLERAQQVAGSRWRSETISRPARDRAGIWPLGSQGLDRRGRSEGAGDVRR